MKTKTVIEMSDSELDELVHEKLGFENYEFVAVEECDNESCHQFKIDGDLSRHASSKEYLARWECGTFVHYSNYIILNKLCADRHIPPGNYLITVSW